MADEKEVKEEPKKKSNLMNIIIISLLVIVIGLLSFTLITLMDNKSSPVSTDEKPTIEDIVVEDSSEPVDTVTLEDFTVNLADEESSRFLRTTIVLEPISIEGRETIEKSNIKIKDLIITTLSSKKFSEIKTAEGKSELKETLIFRLNRITNKAVKNIYFVDFVSQ